MFALKFSIFLLSFAALTEAQDSSYLYHICSNTTTFVRNSPYQANLNILLSSLAGNATRNDINGFYNASTGHDVYEVYGLFLCRGDVSVEVCQECVNLARNDVVQRCPIEKEAIIWYDQCFLRYSNSNIFSSMSQDPGIFMWYVQNITVNVEFNNLLVDTISDAANVAASAPSGEKKFAAKNVTYTWLESLYVLVQCTPDLSKYDCNRCLNLTLSSISICCNNKPGARVLFPSCNLRFQNSSFYNETAVVAMSPPPLSTPVVPLHPSPGPIADGKGSIFFFIILKSFFIVSLYEILLSWIMMCNKNIVSMKEMEANLCGLKSVQAYPQLLLCYFSVLALTPWGERRIWEQVSMWYVPKALVLKNLYYIYELPS